jgi:hypothetical protein
MITTNFPAFSLHGMFEEWSTVVEPEVVPGVWPALLTLEQSSLDTSAAYT